MVIMWKGICRSTASIIAAVSCAAALVWVGPTAVADESAGTVDDQIALNDDAGVAAYSDSEVGASEAVSSLGVTLGSGTTAYAKATLYQQGIRESALDHVIKWRRDALNDYRIKMSYTDPKTQETRYVTMSEYLQLLGISESDYLSPVWSNALERIAIQRAVEASDVSIAHTRPNDESCFSAEYGKDSSYGEILAWNNSTTGIGGAIDSQWADEKAEYIKEVNGQDHGVTGHYVQLISPQINTYGFAYIRNAHAQYRNTFAGESSLTSRLQNTDQSATNLSGDYTLEVNLSDAKLAYGATSNIPASMTVNDTLDAVVTLKYMNGFYTFRGTWSSSDKSVATVSQTGTITATAPGKTTLTILNGTGSFSFDVTVSSRVFRDVNDSTPHAADIAWLADKGISTGWKESDGTYTFRGMDSVKRQDMAAFLYRLAGSPDYTPDWSANPFRDVDRNTPHATEILWLASTGVTQGWTEADGTRTFRGMDSVKRQDMAAFLHRLADYMHVGPTYGKGTDFADVNEATPHYQDIVWLSSHTVRVSEGWAEADGTRTFRGMSPVVRQDMAAFLHRMHDNVINYQS